MSLVMKRFTKGLVLKGITDESNISSLDGEGAIFQNSSDLRLKAYIEGSVRQIVTNSQSQVLTSKTIDADNNILSNIQTSNLKSGVLNTSSTLASASDTQLPSALAVKTYVDNSVAGKDAANEISYSNATSGLSATNVQDAIDEVDGNVDNLVTLSGVALDATNLGSFTGTTIPDNQTNKQALQSLESAHETHTGASTNVHGIGAGNSVVGTGTSQALTNKTLTGAVIDGSTKISAFLLEESEDNSQSGSAVTLTGFTKPIIRLTNASLVSVTGLTASELTGHGGVVTLVNTTANEIAVLNNAGTAANAILTGTDDDIDLAPNGCLLLKYDTVTDKWRVIGGTGGGNVVIKALAGENLSARTPVYLSIGAADAGRTAGSAYKLDASSDDRIEFVGFVKDTVTSGSTAKIVTSGILKGFTGLSVGEPVYLDALNAGVVTQVEPTAFRKWILRLGIAISSTQVLILSDQGMTGYFNEETQGLLTILNNQVSATNLSNIVFDFNDSKKFILDYAIYRRTSSSSFAQNGTLRGVYNEDTSQWLMSDTYAGENAGVTFSITTTGQIQYTSTNISGTSYSGIFEYKIGVGEGVVGSVGGSSGSTGINYITNSDLETDSSGYVTYNDAAATSPVDGVSGSPLSTFTRSTSAPLRGLASGIFSKPASDRQGDGVAFDFLIDAADKAQVLRISFDYSTSVNYVDGDVRVYIFDKTNSRLIEVIDRDLYASSFGKFVGTFQTSPDSVDYRLILHVSSPNANDYTISLDNVIVGPQTIVKGAIVTDWEAFTPTGSFTTNTTYEGKWKRIGDMLHIDARATFTGAPNAATFTLDIPFGLQIDDNKFAAGLFDVLCGSGVLRDSGGQAYTGFVNFSGSLNTIPLHFSNTTTSDVGVVTDPLRTNTINATSVITIGAGDYINLTFSVPILGWSSNVVLSEDAGNREIAFRAGSINASTFTIATTVVFPTLSYDTSNSYDNTTGIFTAPESGLYDISFNVIANTGSVLPTRLLGYIDISGETTLIGTRLSDLVISKDYTLSGAGIYQLTKGDTVKVLVESITNSSSLQTGSTLHSFSVAKRSSPQTIAASEVVAMASYNTFGQALAPASSVVTNWTKVLDTHGAFNASTGEYTIPQSGFYSCVFRFWTQVFTPSSEVNVLDARIQLNGSTFANNITRTGTTAATIWAVEVSSACRYFNKGDIVRTSASTTTATNMNTASTAVNEFSIHKINGVS